MTALHRQMHDDARHDAPTGLANRLRLAEDLEILRGRVVRYGHSYCFALFDIDDFKGYNDGSGHAAGRQRAARRRRRPAGGHPHRRRDLPLRRRGVPRTAARAVAGDRGAAAAERLRTAVEELGIPHPKGGVLTVSAGVAGLGDKVIGPDELFELADQALYRAKGGGRNRVEVFRPEGSEFVEPGVRVLVADDDAMLLLTLSALIEREPGLELVGRAEDADQAIALAARSRPDVVLLDVNMPGGGGLRAAIGDPRRQPGREGRGDQRRRQPDRAVRHDARGRGRLHRQGRRRTRRSSARSAAPPAGDHSSALTSQSSG